jgi:hypothetical protein
MRGTRKIMNESSRASADGNRHGFRIFFSPNSRQKELAKIDDLVFGFEFNGLRVICWRLYRG